MSDIPLVVYDGDCGFCQRFVDWALRPHPARAVAKPWQSLDLAGLGLTAEQVATAVQWLAPDYRTSGARAVADILRGQDGFRRALGLVISCPLVYPIAMLGYQLVARNRHRIRIGGTSCQIPERHAMDD